MPTYLLTWNPDRKHRWNDLRDLLSEGVIDWSCGSRKNISLGSRVFLMKQGPEPRGIVASGKTVSAVYMKAHWDPDMRRRGIRANYVDVRFDLVLGPDPSDILPRGFLKDRFAKAVNWDTPGSGIEIRDTAARILERYWRRFTKTPSTRLSASIEAIENTLTETRRYSRKRDIGLRQLALAVARGKCSACGESYGDLLDGLGAKALQVHHRKQLASSDVPRLSTVRDLAVVCANCHAMIHADSKRAISVERLRRLWRTAAV